MSFGGFGLSKAFLRPTAQQLDHKAKLVKQLLLLRDNAVGPAEPGDPSRRSVHSLT